VTSGSSTDIVAFADRLAVAVERKRSQLVVGLDPRIDLLPMELRGEAVLGRASAASAVSRFCKGIVDAVAPYAVAVKPQVAFFEALGSDGWRAFEEVCAYAREVGLLVIADAKRGDIGSTARAYATAFLEPDGAAPPLADALTVNPYLGHDSVEPFLLACRRYGAGVFFLVHTSNAGARDIQDATLSDGTALWQHVASLVHEWGEDLVAASRASAPSSARPTRGRSARHGARCRRPSCCSPASERRVRRPRTWRALSRAGRRARSSTRHAR